MQVFKKLDKQEEPFLPNTDSLLVFFIVLNRADISKVLLLRRKLM